MTQPLQQNSPQKNVISAPPSPALGGHLAFIIICLLFAIAGAVLSLHGDITLTLMSILVVAISLALAITPLAKWLSFRLGFLDIPDERKKHAHPTPLLGGVAILLAFSASTLLILRAIPASGELTRQVYGMVIGGLFITLMGAMDDKWPLKAGIRLIGQLAVVAFVMKQGILMSFLPKMPLPFLPVVDLGRIGEVILTVIWITGITNAINFLDGLDGLAASVAAVAAIFFAIIAGLTGQIIVTAVSLCIAGAALGFLRYNFRPASIFLGDSGATLLGFLLACIGIVGDWGTEDVEDLLVPVIILGIPIYDMIYITIYRFKAGLVHNLREWAEYVGRDHFHHRLLQIGMGTGQACLFIALSGASLGILAVILKTKGDLDRYDKFLSLILVVLMCLGATVLIERAKAHPRSHSDSGPTSPPEKR